MSLKALLKKLTIERENREGLCHLLAQHYASIDAVESFNGNGTKRQVHWICEKSKNGYAFILLDGVTGHESWYVKDLLKTLSQETNCEFFTACLGCSNYPKLELDLTQMRSVIKQLNSQFN